MVRPRLLVWCARALDFCPVEPQKFKQQLDVSGARFVKNDWSILAHNEVDQSIQNRAVCLSSFSAKLNFARFLRIVSPINLSKTSFYKISHRQRTGCRHRVSNLSRVPCCARKYMGCSTRLDNQLQQCSCAGSHPTHEPRHASHSVFLRQRDVQFTHSWWMEMCSGYI